MGATQSLTRARRWIPLLAIGACLYGQSTTVLPGLYYSSHCDSEIELRNLSAKVVSAQIEGHRSDGSLTGIREIPSTRLRLNPGQRRTIHLDIKEDEAWASISESSTRVIAISAKTSCRDSDKDSFSVVTRPVAYPLLNPGFDLPFDQALRDGSQLLILNLSQTSAHWIACYSAGHLVSQTLNSHANGEMVELCAETRENQIGPFASTRLEMLRNDRALIHLKTAGESIVLQLLKPDAQLRNLFRVDSTIRFDQN